MQKIAIIGAGISGLSLGHLLHGHADITLFEKARGVGGRMSTRRAAPYAFNHGAQYFTARTLAFKNFIAPYLNHGLITPWNHRYACLDYERNSHITPIHDDTQRYIAVPSMNQWAKALAERLHLQTTCKIVSVHLENKWCLVDDHGNTYKDFNWVICTAPSPQTLALLPQSFAYHSHIQQIKMQACFALMLGFNQAYSPPFDAAKVLNCDISWLAFQHQHTQTGRLFSLLVHSSAKYADQHIDSDPEYITQHLLALTSEILGFDVHSPEHTALHAWRYANNLERKQQNPIFIDAQQQLAACGDWCEGGRIENAFTSAYKLSRVLKQQLL